MAFVCLGTIRWVYTYTPYWIFLFFVLILCIYDFGLLNVIKKLISIILDVKRMIFFSSLSYRIRHPFSKNIFLGNNIINKKNRIKRCTIGFGTYLGSYNTLYDVEIGKFCSIGSHINFAIGRHPVDKFVSTHPAFFSTKKQAGFTYVNEDLFDELDVSNKMRIGNDVWIGDNVIFTKKISVGDGAIIGAGSVVTKDIPSYAIVAGVPAKVIKYRFDQEIIGKLSKIDWTSWTLDTIEEKYQDFDDIEKFLQKFSKGAD